MKRELRQPLLHGELCGRILGHFFQVHTELGHGFLESVYKAALTKALRDDGLKVVREQKLSVHFRGIVIGDYFADMVVEDCVTLEVKAKRSIVEAHEEQLLNCLHACDIEVGLLLNFGQRAEFRRRLHTNDRKLWKLAAS